MLRKTLVATAVALSSSVNAAGIYLYEMGTNDIGLASAGAAARAHDSSVLATNPAGLSNVSGKSFTTGLVGLYGDAEYEMDNGTSANNIIGFVPLGSAFYSQSVGDKITLGIGLYSNYGIGLEYDNFIVEEVICQAITLQPSMAFQINEHWSLGAGLGIQYGILDVDEGAQSVDDTDIAYNAKVGLLFSPNQGTRIGLGYSSETELDFDAKVLGQDVEPSVMPQHVTLSLYHELNDTLALTGSLGWQDWSAYEPFTQTATEDTYHIALGARYKLSGKTTWNMGVAFDTSMYKDQSEGDFTVPTGDAWRIATGVEYQFNENHALGVAFEALLIDSSEVNSSPFGPFGEGSFDNPTLYFLSATYTWSGK